jgi:hypothetical protein
MAQDLRSLATILKTDQDGRLFEAKLKELKDAVPLERQPNGLMATTAGALEFDAKLLLIYDHVPKDEREGRAGVVWAIAGDWDELIKTLEELLRTPEENKQRTQDAEQAEKCREAIKSAIEVRRLNMQMWDFLGRIYRDNPRSTPWERLQAAQRMRGIANKLSDSASKEAQSDSGHFRGCRFADDWNKTAQRFREHADILDSRFEQDRSRAAFESDQLFRAEQKNLERDMKLLALDGAALADALKK